MERHAKTQVVNAAFRSSAARVPTYRCGAVGDRDCGTRRNLARSDVAPRRRTAEDEIVGPVLGVMQADDQDDSMAVLPISGLGESFSRGLNGHSHHGVEVHTEMKGVVERCPNARSRTM